MIESHMCYSWQRFQIYVKQGVSLHLSHTGISFI